jgi:hypothetical protein
MDRSEYKAIAAKIQAELESLEIQQEEIERHIARLRQTLLGLAPLCESPHGPLFDGFIQAIDSLSLTDAARQILQAAKAPLAPTEIKQQLLNMGRDLSSQKNVMASIHSLLKRLVESNEIETKDSGLTYQWKTRIRHRKHVAPSGRRRRLALFYGEPVGKETEQK